MRPIPILLVVLLLASPLAAQTTVTDYATAHDLIAHEAFTLMNADVVETGWRYVATEGGTADVKYQVEVQIPDYAAPIFIPASPQALYNYWRANLPAAIGTLLAKWRANYTIMGRPAFNTPYWQTLRVDGPTYGGGLFFGPSIRSRYRVDATTGAHILRLDLLAGQ